MYGVYVAYAFIYWLLVWYANYVYEWAYAKECVFTLFCCDVLIHNPFSLIGSCKIAIVSIVFICPLECIQVNHSLHSSLALAFHNIASIYPNRAMSNSVSVQFSPVAFGVSFSFWFRFRFHFFNLFSSSIHILVDVVFSSIRHEKREKKSRPLHRMLNFFSVLMRLKFYVCNIIWPLLNLPFC